MSDLERVGAWRVVRELATGGFGTVWEVLRESDGAQGALKVLHGEHAASPALVARFMREATVLRELAHDNIVRLLDAGLEATGRPYLVMELLAGTTLADQIAQRGRLGVSDALGVLEAVCSALAAAHARSIIHRDVKAANVMLCGERIVLVDFGIARITDDAATALTADHTAIGTPSAMAPEQIAGGKPDARTDVYALGALLFHMLTGKPPFDDPSPTMTQYLHQHARRPRASALCPVPELLDGVIARAMAIVPAQRFDTAFAVLAAARLAVHDGAVPAEPELLAAFALLVTVTAPADASWTDTALFDDLEGVLPQAERHLAALGIGLAADLGQSALFAAPARVGDPGAIATGLAAHVQARRARDPRIRVRICVREGRAPFIGAAIQPCALVRVAEWTLPGAPDGVWVIGDDPVTGARRLDA